MLNYAGEARQAGDHW